MWLSAGYRRSLSKIICSQKSSSVFATIIRPSSRYLHRVVHTIFQVLENLKYVPSVFLDVSSAFDRVWHRDFSIKSNHISSPLYFDCYPPISLIATFTSTSVLNIPINIPLLQVFPWQKCTGFRRQSSRKIKRTNFANISRHIYLNQFSEDPVQWIRTIFLFSSCLHCFLSFLVVLFFYLLQTWDKECLLEHILYCWCYI